MPAQTIAHTANFVSRRSVNVGIKETDFFSENKSVSFGSSYASLVVSSVSPVLNKDTNHFLDANFLYNRGA